MAIESIATAVRHGARQQQACKIINITVRTLQYWRVNGLEGPFLAHSPCDFS